MNYSVPGMCIFKRYALRRRVGPPGRERTLSVCETASYRVYMSLTILRMAFGGAEGWASDRKNVPVIGKEVR